MSPSLANADPISPGPGRPGPAQPDQRFRLAPSLLSADFSRLRDEVQAVEAAGADLLHLDVMDNHYVPNLTVGPMVLAAIRPHVKLPIDVHLMVEPVDDLALAFIGAGADLVSFHPEASRHPDRTLQLIRSRGCRCGLVLNPATPLNWLDHTAEALDLLLVMSVNPGFGGQSFIPTVLPKIRAARQRLDALRERTGHQVWLEVDGGIKTDNIAAVAAAGADTFVAGSAVFGAPDDDGGYRGILTQFRQALTAAAGPS